MIFGAEGGPRNKRQFDISEFELCGTECTFAHNGCVLSSLCLNNDNILNNAKQAQRPSVQHCSRDIVNVSIISIFHLIPGN